LATVAKMRAGVLLLAGAVADDAGTAGCVVVAVALVRSCGCGDRGGCRLVRCSGVVCGLVGVGVACRWLSL
jgi:hypothetical protein